MQKPRTDVYTIMLILSLIAIIAGCVFLYLEIREYNGQTGGPAAQLSAPQQTTLALAGRPGSLF